MDVTHKLFLGIAAGLAAGFLWGFVFLTPQILTTYSPVEITFGRFLFFGLCSLFYFNKVRDIFQRLRTRELVVVTALSAAGFWFYTILLVFSIQQGGAVITPLIIGLLPITISLCASKGQMVTLTFAAGLIFIFTGLMVLQLWPLLSGTGDFSNLNIASIIGLIAALGLWTWYALGNTAFLHRNPWISKRDITSFIGLISFAIMLLIAAVMIDVPLLLSRPDFGSYIFWCAIIGAGSSWIASWLWNICSTNCPLQISAPLIVSETIFGLLFTFIYQQRLPIPTEAIAITLFLGGAVLCIRSEIFQKSKRQPAH